jgi:hypothetical protein
MDKLLFTTKNFKFLENWLSHFLKEIYGFQMADHLPKLAIASLSYGQKKDLCSLLFCSYQFYCSFTVEFPPPKEKSPVFSQLEKMIKLTAFDQKKFQKQVRVAAGLEMEEAKEEMKEEGIRLKSKSRSKSPVPRNDASKDRNGYVKEFGTY